MTRSLTTTTPSAPGAAPDYSRSAALDPIPMPGGRLAPVRAWNWGAQKLANQMASVTDDAERQALLVALVRQCVPSITDEELDELPLQAFDEIPLYAASTLHLAEATLGKNAGAGPGAGAAGRRNQRSTRTTPTRTPSPASGA